MKKNMGTVDRVIRIGVAVVLGWLGLTQVVAGVWGVGLVLVALVLLGTSLVGYCPLYAVLGVNTCSTKKEK